MDDDSFERKDRPAAGVVDVLVPVALDHAYSYRVPRGMALKVGDVVGVPLGPREGLGVAVRRWNRVKPCSVPNHRKP